VVYSGGPDVPVKIIGAIEGAAITEFSDGGVFRMRGDRRRSARTLVVSIGIAMTLAVILSGFLVSFLEATNTEKPIPTALLTGIKSICRPASLVNLITLILALAIVYYLAGSTHQTIPQALLS
jgi:H+/Cl- antiporter ClcA